MRIGAGIAVETPRGVAVVHRGSRSRKTVAISGRENGLGLRVDTAS